MVRFELKLLPENDSDASIALANSLADKSMNHIKGIIGNKRCHKHPSYVNKIKIVAVKDQDPKIQVVDYCCKDFHKILK